MEDQDACNGSCRICNVGECDERREFFDLDFARMCVPVGSAYLEEELRDIVPIY